MSAIWGLLRFDETTVVDGDLNRMGAALRSRCGDGRATFLDGQIGLGHGLMRVTREDGFDRQPLYDRDTGLIVVADCRIDNREELAAALELDPVTLKATPDSALILQAYRRWGDACPTHLIGDFAFAVWEVARKRLLLVRDPMGQRQLFYHLGDGFVAFATDIAALWAAPGVPRLLDEVWLGHFANQFRVPLAGRTALSGIRGLCGGTTLAVAASGTAIETRNWSPHADPAHIGHDDAYYVATYRKILEEAVACRVRRLVDPPGLSFSAGFDSGSIAALAGPALPEGSRLLAATSVMPQRAAAWPRDPRPWVECCKRDMPHLDVRYVDFRDRDPLDGLEAHFAANGAAPVGVTSYADAELYAVLRAAGARLAMDGHGGDYTLNPRGDMALAQFAARARLRSLWLEIRAHRRATGESWASILIRRIAVPLIPAAVRSFVEAAGRGFRRKASILVFKHSFVARLVDAGAIVPAERFSPRASARDTRPAMVELLARISAQPPALAGLAAANGLDLTRPFYDRRVIEFALAVPQHLDVRGGRNRYLACTALADVLPFEFQTRSRGNDGTIDDPLSLTDVPLRDAIAHLATTRAADAFDLAKLQAMLDRSSDPASGSQPAREQMRRDAVRSVVFARYVAWIDPRNG